MREQVAIRALKLALAGVALTVGIASCSFGDTPDGVAKELIEGDLATQYGLGEITATCVEPPNQDVGTVFTCESPTDFGLAEWSAEMTAEDTVTISALNTLSDPDIDLLEGAALEVLARDVGLVIPAEDFNCGTGPIVLGAELILDCTLTDPGTGVEEAWTIDLVDLQSGEFIVDIVPGG